MSIWAGHLIGWTSHVMDIVMAMVIYSTVMEQEQRQIWPVSCHKGLGRESLCTGQIIGTPQDGGGLGMTVVWLLGLRRGATLPYLPGRKGKCR